MSSPGLLRFRMMVAFIAGIFFVMAAATSKVLPGALSVHGFVALFGIAWFLQAGYLQRRLIRNDPS